MGDDKGVFHIVERGNGEIEIVKIVKTVRIKYTSNKTKLNKEISSIKCDKLTESNRKEKCDCVMCQPILEEIRENEKLAKIPVLRNYSRAKFRNDTEKEAKSVINNKSPFIHNKEAEMHNVTDCSITVKTEPEIDIMDQDETGMVTESEPTNLQMPSTLTQNVVKQVGRLTNPGKTITPPNSTKTGSNKMSLLELTTKNIKCNICGMVFEKSINQLQSLRTHFLQHKTSVNRVFKNYTGVKYHSDKRNRVEQNEEPLRKKILIKEVKRKGSLENNGLRDMQFGNSSVSIRRIVATNSSSTVNNSNSKLIKVTKVHLDSVRNTAPKLDSSSSTNTEKSKFIKLPLSFTRGKEFAIGNTIIKPSSGTTNKSSRRDQTVAASYVERNSEAHQLKAIDSDDDIEIVEQKPELIVIDDIDDEDSLKCNSKSD